MNALGRNAGFIASLLGVVGFASVASLAVFFAVGGPFGAINDWSIGLMGVLTALLALGIAERGGIGRSRALGPALALLGSSIVVIGAALVISRTTGFMLAGLVESVGFGLVGLWLVGRARSTGASVGGMRLSRLGLGAGVLMAVGLAAAPGVVMGLDDLATAPAWVWIAFVGWLGIFFLFPAWCVLVGRELDRGVPAVPTSVTTGPVG